MHVCDDPRHQKLSQRFYVAQPIARPVGIDLKTVLTIDYAIMLVNNRWIKISHGFGAYFEVIEFFSLKAPSSLTLIDSPPLHSILPLRTQSNDLKLRSIV